ncbi:tetratricopeptide repeat protein [Candidatus Uabimicrobium sp. HlEnr_7]|uniref:tetratricopeptide repeat protein n=1 Tax=Candidatus Uabimicrobium helgolandensis TaxID=3095367 RepID=UPI0035591E1F
MAQSLDEAFCNHVITQGIISKETVNFVKDKYPSVCVREALLLESQLQIEYYTATLSILKELELNKSDISEYWDKKFIAHIKKTQFLTDDQVNVFLGKCKNQAISFRELLIISSILSVDNYIEMFNELLQEHSPNTSRDFDTSEMEFVEKTLDSIESSLKKSTPDVSEKTVNPDFFNQNNTHDVSNQTLDMVEPPTQKSPSPHESTANSSPIRISPNNSYFSDDASAMTIDAVESPIAAQENLSQKLYEENDASAMTIDAVESPITTQENLSQNNLYEENDASAMTIDAVESPIVIQGDLSQNNLYEKNDASAMTIDAAESPIIAQENLSQKLYEENDASAMTIDTVEPPITDLKQSYFDSNIDNHNDLSAMTVDSVQSPIKSENNSYFENDPSSITINDPKTSAQLHQSPLAETSSYFSSKSENKNENIDTAKTIASDITFSEYMKALDEEKTLDQVQTPVNNEAAEQTLDSEAPSFLPLDTENQDGNLPVEVVQAISTNESCDASSETLLEQSTESLLVDREDRVATVKESHKDIEATLDMNSKDVNELLHSEKNVDIDASAKTIQEANDFDSYGNTVVDQPFHAKNREMEDAFPSSILEQIDGLDEKTTNLTNLIREMRESQVFQIPEGITPPKKNIFALFVITIFLITVSTSLYLWINLEKSNSKPSFAEQIETLKQEKARLKESLLQKKSKSFASFYYEAKQYDLVIKLLSKNAKSPNDQFLLAKCYSKKNQHTLAENILRKLTKLHPQNPEYMFFFAQVLSHRNEEPIVILKTYDKVIDLGFPRYLVLLKKLQLNVQNELIGVDEFEKACSELKKFNKNSPNLLKIQGKFYLKEKNWQKALPFYSQLISEKPNAFLYLERGQIYYEIGKFSEAFQDFKKVVTLSSELKAQAHFYMGLIYLEFKKAKFALKNFNEAIEHDPGQSVYFEKRGQLFFLTKQYTKALNDFNIALKKDSEKTQLYGNLALVYQKLGKKESAEINLNKAVVAGTPQSLFVVSQYYFMLGKTEEAITFAKKSINLAPRTNWQAYKHLGDIFAKSQQKQSAIDNWKKALKIKPSIRSLRGKTN